MTFIFNDKSVKIHVVFYSNSNCDVRFLYESTNVCYNNPGISLVDYRSYDSGVRKYDINYFLIRSTSISLLS